MLNEDQQHNQSLHGEDGSQRRESGQGDGHSESCGEPCSQGAVGQPQAPLTVYIYTLADPRTGEVRYVGKTIDLKVRVKGHLKQDKHNSHKRNWVRSLTKEGLKPVIEMLEVFENSDDNDWQDAERFWIETLRFLGCRLTNMESGGVGGKSPSIETRYKMSEARKGMKLSAEHRAKIGKAGMGRKHSEGFSVKMRGRIISEETREKLRKASSGRKHSEATRLKISQVKKVSQKSKDALAKLASLNTGRKGTTATRLKLSELRRGRKLSKETRANMSLAQKANKLAHEALARCWKLNLGRPLTEKHRTSISIAKKGMKHTLEALAKMSKTRKGRKPSDASRAKMSASQRGRKFTPETIAKMRLGQQRRQSNRLASKIYSQIELGLISSHVGNTRASTENRLIVNTAPTGGTTSPASFLVITESS